MIIKDPRYPEDYLVWRKGSGRTVEILDIVVHSERRCGRGKALVYELYQRIPMNTRLVWAITRADNRIAHLFYEGLRFRLIANLYEFYRDNEKLLNCIDAVMYGKDVS